MNHQNRLILPASDASGSLESEMVSLVGVQCFSIQMVLSGNPDKIELN